MQLKLIVNHFGRQIFATSLAIDASFQDPFNAATFPCLLWTHAATLPKEFRIKLTHELVQSACSYAVCGGAECELLHDYIDETIVQDAIERSLDHARALVMTSWHAQESMADVSDFFVRHTNFGGRRFTQLLVVHLGGTAAEHRAAEHRAMEQQIVRASSRAGAV